MKEKKTGSRIKSGMTGRGRGKARPAGKAVRAMTPSPQSSPAKGEDGQEVKLIKMTAKGRGRVVFFMLKIYGAGKEGLK
jgi:hypothetical protein